GDAQTAPILTELSRPLVVTVLGLAGEPVSGQTVTFAVDSVPVGAMGQLVTPVTATTNALGQAAASITLGTKVGVYKITAASPGLAGSPVEFRVRATAGAPQTLTYVAGDKQTQPINSLLQTALLVRVVDVGQNPVPGVRVQFSLDSIPPNATGQALQAVNAITDSAGQASALMMLGSKVGVYLASALVPGLTGSPVRFVAYASAGRPVTLVMTSGNEQVGLVLTELLAPFVVTVVDIGGNPVPEINVRFALDSLPSGATGCSLRVINAVTDFFGRASAFLTLGDKIGRYTVTATSAGLIGSPARFGATARILVGDVNSDREVNIADLTSVVDHILGRIKLVGNDSVKADVNNDGKISVADVVTMRNFLLALPEARFGFAEGSMEQFAPPQQGVRSDYDTTSLVRSEFVLTENGLRFNVSNLLPIKGLQLLVRFRSIQDIKRPDVIFPRAAMDSFHVSASGREVRIVAYNLLNIPIAAGDGPLFRLPIKLASIDEIESGELIVSTPDTVVTFDRALKATAARRFPSPKEIPVAFLLYQNYPNPFNASTRIDYEVADVEGRAARVLIQVYNLLGEKVKTLASGQHPSGRYTVTWDGTDDRGAKVPSGTYYYRLISGDYASGKRMILLK
ncbi:MAG: T9SS type A sorting domain-containing protein, partial [Ignavibacteria bacterium]|nr:T9SS type A sorting domain-containing protein [Ignavibacteria bacterium]